MSTNQKSLLKVIPSFQILISPFVQKRMFTKLPVMRMIERLSGMSVTVCLRQHSSYLCNQRHSRKDFKAEQISNTCVREVDKRKFSDSRSVMAEANPTNGFFSMGLNTLKVWWNMERGNEEGASRRGRESKRRGG